MSIISNSRTSCAGSHLEHALALAAQGFHVFPLEPGTKLPAIDKYPERATRDPEHIRRWWTCPVMGTPLDRNIAISTTRYSDAQALLVIDVDQKQGKDGNASLATLEAAHGALPATLEASTPSGGRHLFFAVDAAVPQSAGKLGDGLDIRGRGGYVVAAGSTTDQGRYEWLNDHPVNTAPDWLVRWCWKDAGARAERTAEPAAPIEVNEALAVERALDYLRHHAPEGYEGARDETAFKVACRLRDFGVDELTAHALMLDHWPCYPMLENLEHPVHSAYTYAKGVMGGDAPEAQFSPVELDGDSDPFAPEKPKARRPLVFEAFDPFTDPASLPPRKFILGKLLLAGAVTQLIAPGSVGKSTFSLQVALAIAARRGDLCGMDVKESGTVLVVNSEDDRDEQYRRLLAAMKHFNVDPSTVEGRVHLHFDDNEPFKIARRTADGDIKPVDMQSVIERVKATGAKVLIVDPQAETHNAKESSNEEMIRVMEMYRTVARKTGCAVLINHHPRKPPDASSDGHAGNMDSSRGASSQTFLVRIQATMYTMSPKDAKRYKIGEEVRHRYLRLDDSKTNYSLKGGEPLWMERVGVPLGNGDEVGVLAPVDLEVVREANQREETRRTEEEKYQERLGKVVDVLQNTGPISRHRLLENHKDQMGFGKHALAALVKKAIEEGDLLKTESGKVTLPGIPTLSPDITA